MWCVDFLFVSLSQCVLMCTLGVPLTPSNVMRVVREIEKWWGGVGSESLARWLFIPESKQKEIRQKYAGDMEQKKMSIWYWIKTDPLASWRRLIWALDILKKAHEADSIRPNAYAEPLTGSHQSGILH